MIGAVDWLARWPRTGPRQIYCFCFPSSHRKPSKASLAATHTHARARTAKSTSCNEQTALEEKETKKTRSKKREKGAGCVEEETGQEMLCREQKYR